MTTPADIIARAVMCDLGCCTGEEPDGVDHMEAERIIAALDAAGYDIVARDPRPATCPTCGSDDPEVRARLDMSWRPDGPCPDPWHGEGR